MSDESMDPVGDLVEEYALGMLHGSDLHAFEARLREDASLRGEVAASRDALTAMGYSIPVRPDAALRARVLAVAATASAVKDHSPVVDLRSRRRAGVPAWVAMTAIAAAAVIITKLTLDLRDLREIAAAAEVRVAARDLDLAGRDSLIAQLADPSLEAVTLAATGNDRPGVRVYVDRRRGVALLSAVSIDAVPAGEAYQLWFFVRGNPAPVPSVTFNPDSSGRAMLTGVPLPDGVVTGTAITREPEKGSPSPTSPALFVGEFVTR